ncbi:Na+/H+-dicarboxylate symporter [Sphingopyxis panaciterrae]|nr:Na+/H+-dicarboxylate symporter [Sphingopyxis panaciterrae]
MRRPVAVDGSASAPKVRLPSFGVQVLIGLGLGVGLGFWARSLGEASALAEALQTVGSIFVQLLRALVPPLVFTAIVASIAALKDLQNARGWSRRPCSGSRLPR